MAAAAATTALFSSLRRGLATQPRRFIRLKRDNVALAYWKKKKRLLWRQLNPEGPPQWSKKTVRRREAAKLQPWSVSSEEFEALRTGQQPYPHWEKRDVPAAGATMAELRREYTEVARDGREFPEFHPGDKVAVYRFVDLHDHKYDIIRGTVIAKGGEAPNHWFRLINREFGSTYEFLYPLYSPFIREIKVLTRGTTLRQRKKAYFIRDFPASSWVVKRAKKKGGVRKKGEKRARIKAAKAAGGRR